MDICSRVAEPGSVEWNVNVGPLLKRTNANSSTWYCRAGARAVWGQEARSAGLGLRRWVDEFRQEPASAAWRPTTQATPISADQDSEIAWLRQENERLRIERDILQKVCIAISAGIQT